MKSLKDIIKPADTYGEASQIYSENVNEYFDSLVKESKIKINENKETCDKYYIEIKKKDKATKKNRGNKVLKGFLIFFAVVFYILMVLGIVFLAKKITGVTISIPFLVGGAILGTGMVLLICLVLNPKIKTSEKLIKKMEEEIKKLETEAWNQLEPLNNLFTWNIPQGLITQTIPLIQLDRIFTPGRHLQLSKKYGYQAPNNDASIVSVQSGTILGNPFLFERVIYTYMGQQVYTGSIVISWTETSTDSNGRTVTIHRTQTLTASVTKPKPFYDFDTQLVYGNDAAPNLTFTRKSSNIDLANISERKLSRIVKKSDKALEKKARKSGTFTKMGNSKFEALFNATDRNNETEFRLLFTPIAQENIIDLLKSKPYGDDFSFQKYGPINIIRSAHSQNFNYHSAPWLFTNFDFEKLEQNFKTYCNDYFTSMYYDLAPILSIPLYQQHKAKEYIYKSSEGLTDHEIESLVNYHGSEHFCHPETSTDCILKSHSSADKSGLQTATIDCYSYKAVERVEHVPMMGGDGYMHDVPVVWYEYIPLSKRTSIKALDYQGYGDQHKIKSVDTIYKKFGIKSVYGQKGITLHIGR